MGRMKEIFMEIQEKFGNDLENAPVGFTIDGYLKEKALSETNEDVSYCCGANLKTAPVKDGPDYKDLGICPDCLENI